MREKNSIERHWEKAEGFLCRSRERAGTDRDPIDALTLLASLDTYLCVQPEQKEQKNV